MSCENYLLTIASRKVAPRGKFTESLFQEAIRAGWIWKKALIPEDHISCLKQEHLTTGKEKDLIFRP